MAWYGVITDSGKAAIEDHLASGAGLNLNVVKTGTGTVPIMNIRQTTNMVAYVDDGSVIGKKSTAGGAQVQVSIQAFTTRYVMKEIGLFATLDDESQVLIAYYNDDGNGIEVPAVADFPDFNYVLYCILDAINGEDLTITLDLTHSVLIGSIMNNLTTPDTTEGTVLDARQGRVLNETKADKVSTAIDGNLASFDENGNLEDSGKKASDFVTISQKGVADGVASLDNSGKIPANQLPSVLPSVTSADNGKILIVANGAWAVGDVYNANGVSF